MSVVAGFRGHTNHRLGDRLPAILVLSDFGPLLGLKTSRLAALQAAGDLECFELLPRVGARRRYSGKKVQAWLDGELPLPAAPPIFVKARRRP